MDAPPQDTHPDAEKVQLDLLRNASTARRFALVRSLSRTVIGLSRRAIRRANPSAGELEIARAFISLHYGEKLAELVYRELKRSAT